MPRDGVLVRRLTLDDAAACRALRQRALDEHPDAFTASVRAWRAGTDAQRSALLGPGPAGTELFVVGAFAPELCGMISFRREGKQTVRHKGSVRSFFVVKEHRRCGVGSALVATLLDEVRACDGVAYVRCMVSSTSHAALQLLEKHDFERYGVERGSLRHGDHDIDQIYLLRKL